MWHGRHGSHRTQWDAGAAKTAPGRAATWDTVTAVTDYRSLNRASWDERAPAHAASRDYSVAAFADDPAHLSDVVRFDLPAWVISAASAASICNATSVRTQCR